MFADGEYRLYARLNDAVWTLLLLIILGGPFIAPALDLYIWLWDGKSDAIGEILFFDRQLLLLAKSVGFAGAVTIGNAVIAIGAASLIWTHACRSSRFFVLGLFSMIAIPPYMHALAWQSLVALANDLTGQIGFAPIRFSGWAAAWWSQMMALAPVSVGLSLLGLFTVDKSLFDAGRMARSDFEIFRKIVLPLAAPPLRAAAGFVFLYTLLDYSVPSTFQKNTYALEIFAEFSVSHEAARALLVALPLLAVSLLVLTLVLRQVRQIAVPVSAGNIWKGSLPLWPRWFLLVQKIAFALLVMQLATLVVGLAGLMETVASFVESINDAKSEITQTFRSSALAAILSLPLAFVAARRIARGGWLWLLAILLPIAVPGSLHGIGLISFWNNVWTAGVYDSEAILVLTYLARFLPVATLVLVARLRRIEPLLIDAARVHMPGHLTSWVQVYIPMIMQAGMASMFLVFALSIGELPATILTIPPGSGTIAIRIYSYLHYGASNMVANLCLVIPIIMFLFVGVLSFVGWVWQFFLPRPFKG